jgi:hypothetical protein
MPPLPARPLVLSMHASHPVVPRSAPRSSRRTLLCCLGLKQHTPEAVRELLAAVQDNQLL